MKCPKCHYLSFEPEPRCRHCGHDFSVVEPDLFSAATPFDQVELKREAPGEVAPALGRRLDLASAAPRATTVDRHPPPPPADRRATELPLFVAGLDRGAGPVPAAPPAIRAVPALPVQPTPAPRAPAASLPSGQAPVGAAAAVGPASRIDVPVDVPAAPRPLAVRRPVIEGPRSRTSAADLRRVGPLDRDLTEDLARLEAEDRRRAALASAAQPAGGASLGSRVAAGLLDVVLLGLVNAVAIVLTLRLVGLTMAELPWAAAVSLVAFLWLVDMGYVMLFTASAGQTIGKMAIGLRVVDISHERPRERLTVAQAAYRALLTFPSVMALGAGFLPALVGSGGAVHDRLTHTRVIRA
jgi:uncharacterized RDD family membrane protein YckC